MNIRNHIEYGAVVALLGLCRLLPERLIHSLFTSLAKLMHALLGSRRRMALQNMEIAFPEKNGCGTQKPRQTSLCPFGRLHDAQHADHQRPYL